MMYFCNGPKPIDEIDIEQLSLVRAFQSEVAKEGGLYWTYKDTEEFRKLLRLHLVRQVQEYGDAWGRDGVDSTKVESAIVKHEAAAPAPIPADEESGYYDLIEIAEDSMSDVNQASNNIAEAINRLGEKISQRATEIKEAKNSGSVKDAKAAKHLINAAAGDMNDFVARMRVEIPLFSKSFGALSDALIKAAELAAEFAGNGADDVIAARDIALRLKDAMVPALSQIQSLESIVANSPRATSALNRAKRATTECLSTFSDELEAAIRLCGEIAEVFESVRKQIEEGSDKGDKVPERE
jgi:hypothetical protein